MTQNSRNLLNVVVAYGLSLYALEMFSLWVAGVCDWQTSEMVNAWYQMMVRTGISDFQSLLPYIRDGAGAWVKLVGFVD